ncbi:MAG: metallophosphoesterase [Oscillospiraceae bacterium]|nr:metallophosphoesterase [Oscillospiraceae bacterium]
MKKLTRSMAAFAAAIQILLPFPVMAEEAEEPYYTVTAAPDEQNGVLTLDDGTEWVKVLDLEFGQDYLITVTDQDGTQELLTVSDGEQGQYIWQYFTTSLATTAAPYWGLRTGEYHLVNDSGQLATDCSLFPAGAIIWQHDDFRLVNKINGAPSYLKYDAESETPFSLTEDPQEAAEVNIYTNGETLASSVTVPPCADSYVLENSGYAAPTFTVELKENVIADTIRWYTDGVEQPCQEMTYTADSLTDQPAGMHRICCVVEGHDENGVHYRSASVNASFIIAKGVLPDSIMTFSDIHEEYDRIGDAIEQIMLKTDGYIPSLVICSGDLCNGQQSTYDTMLTVNAPQIKAALGGLDAVYVAGNHDSPKAASYLSATAGLGAAADLPEEGGVIFDGSSEAVAQNGTNSRDAEHLIVYGLNYDAAIIRDGDTITYSYENVLPDLEAFLQKTAEQYQGETIIISAHSGLHVLGKQEGSVTPGSGQQLSSWIGYNPYNLDRSYDMVQLLNRYAEDYDMDIVYLFGHDHSRNENEMLLQDGDTIVSTQYYKDWNCGKQTIHFTYANAGYLSTRIGSADSKFCLLYRDGDKLVYDLIRTTDSEDLHTEITTKYRQDYASVEGFVHMAMVDYEQKTGIAVYPEAERQADGTVIVTIKDAAGSTLDTYTLDAKTGIGTDEHGREVNLPQTGMDLWEMVMLLGSSFTLLIAGSWLLYRGSRRKDRDR